MIALTMRANQILHSPYPSLENFMVILETEVPVSKRENSAPLSYNVYIGDNTKRIFKHGTLPTFIKSKLAMVKSIPKEEWNAYKDDELFNELDCYLPQNHTQNNPEFKNIGWCVSDSIYVIILSEEELSELKGIRIDTREKSQSKSKTNS
jgi:hypothetical protein